MSTETYVKIAQEHLQKFAEFVSVKAPFPLFPIPLVTQQNQNMQKLERLHHAFHLHHLS